MPYYPPSSSGSGTVTSTSVVTANGLAGTVANSTTTPAITLSTGVTGVLKGNGTAISAATSGTDYALPNADTTGKSAKTDALNSATTVVNVSSATAPVANQVLTATSSTAATWQTPAGGGGGGSLSPTFMPASITSTVGFGQTGYYGLFTATAGKAITKVETFLPYIQSGSTIAIGLYDYSSNALLASGTATTTSTIGFLTVTLGASYTVTLGGHYWYAILNQTAESTTQFGSMSNANNAIYSFNLTGKTTLDSTLPTAGRNSTNQVPYLMFY